MDFCIARPACRGNPADLSDLFQPVFQYDDKASDQTGVQICGTGKLCGGIVGRQLLPGIFHISDLDGHIPDRTASDWIQRGAGHQPCEDWKRNLPDASDHPVGISFHRYRIIVEMDLERSIRLSSQFDGTVGNLQYAAPVFERQQPGTFDPGIYQCVVWSADDHGQCVVGLADDSAGAI